ncbi:cytochrome P450 3A14-like isoform X2 [Amblyomma americanum]
MFTVAATLTLLLAALVALLVWRRRHFSYFEKIGIPGPKPNLLWGNLWEYQSLPQYKVFEKWFQKYGDVFGFYNGDVPFVALKDLDFIEYVCVRNFNNFVDRGIIMVTEEKHPLLQRSIMNETSPRWKGLRSAVAHGFTSAKLKMMMPTLQKDADMFIRSLEKHAESGQEVNLLPKYEELSMEYIARGLFGIDEHFLGIPHHPMLGVAKSVFRSFMKGPFHFIGQSTTMFGSLMKPFFWLTLAFKDFKLQALSNATEDAVNTRRKDSSFRRQDMLQNLLEAEYIDEEPGHQETHDGNVITKPRVLTTTEIVVNAATLFVAGFETTATALSYVTFVLAKYPDIQENVRKEVCDAISASGSLDYETVTRKLKYLDEVIAETLRRYPPALTSITRKAIKDFEYNGIKFKAGTCFMIAQYHIHMDQRFWPDPLEFDPGRASWKWMHIAFCPHRQKDHG